MDLCSKIIHSFWNCQICLNNKGISSLYAMKRCSTGEGTNVTLEYDLRDANEIISWVALRELWMKRTSQRVTHSLTSELHEKLLKATNEIISLASSKKCSNAIRPTTKSNFLAIIFSFFCVQNARSLLSCCALCRSKSGPPKKIVTYWNAKKRVRLLPFFSSVRCAVLKDPPKKSEVIKKTRVLTFFPHISMLCSPFLSSYYLNAKMEGTVAKPCLPSGLTRRLCVKEFLSSKLGGAKFKKKQNAK